MASGYTVTVRYTTATGTATGGASCTNGIDYISTSGTLTFTAGQTSKTIPVTTCNDTLDEDDETFFVNLSSPTNATFGDNQGVGTILDNDPPPAMSINDVSVAEGTGSTTSASFTVSLSAVSGRTVTAQYATASGTATGGTACTSGVDYISTSGMLTFTAGQTSKTIPVTICGDATYEEAELFVVNLSAPSNATLADSQGVGMISDEDTATRVISYSYDGLLRLTGATETPGLSYVYSYDDAGNRTSVQVNGVTTESRTYNAANQVAGWTYDNAGNLIGDGTANYTYDALNRVLTTTQGSEARTNTYNGNGVLVTQLANGSTTRYTQDLASPLSQVLQTTQGSATTHYLYGLERLASRTGTTRTWYVGDALGSVRRTLDDTGAVLGTTQYDPWGNVEGGASPSPFGFTGELQDPSIGLVNLRARWYSSSRGTFTSRDPFDGFPERPYSLHPYQYGYSDPVLNIDPSGRCIDERIPWIGEPGCRIEEGILKGNVDVAGFQQYSADVVEGMGLPGAVVVDALAGTHHTEDILSHARVGTVLGMAVTTIVGGRFLSRLGAGAEASVTRRILTGAATSGSIDYLSQVLRNRMSGASWSGSMTSVNGPELLASIIGGGILGGIGNPFKLRGNVAALRRYMAISGGVSGFIGAASTWANPNATCGDVLRAFFINAMAGGAFTGTSLIVGGASRYMADAWLPVNSTASLYLGNILGGGAGGVASNALSNVLQRKAWDDNLKSAMLWGAAGGAIQSAVYAAMDTPEQRAAVRAAAYQRDVEQGLGGRRVMNDMVELSRNSLGEFLGDLFSGYFGTYLPIP